jgi:hypothetical protein
MVRLARDAVSYAKDVHYATLDYSLPSLAKLETIVAKLHADKPGPLARLLGEAPSKDEMKLIAAMLGGYAGEVYRRTNGGEWRIEGATGACGVQLDGVWIFPVQRIHTQIKTGLKSDYISPLQPSQLSI